MTAVPYTDEKGLRDYRESAASAGDRRAVAWWLLILAFVLGFLFGSVTRAESCVRLIVRPRVMLEPTTIRIEARVAKHADHRAYRLDWDSDTGSTGSSTRPLSGDAGAELLTLQLPDQPPGHYEFLARIFDQAGHVTGSDRAFVDAPSHEAGQ